MAAGNNSWIFISVLLMLGSLVRLVFADEPTQIRETCIEVAPVWAGHPVGFSLLSCPERQYVAFYDQDRQLTVGCRKYSETTWHFVKLSEHVGWDSHNYITMAIDDDGCIHLCANMHSSPLVYFRTKKPGDIDSFERIISMVGQNEEKCTYPSFFRGPAGEFLFTYRSGGSGNGDQYFNLYDHKTKTWKRLLNAPLTSGEGKMNAYFTGLRLYQDGYYHIAWVWRDSPCCSLNHDLSYARSKDLIHWETSDGKPLSLPITLSTAEIVDPVPVKAGLINGGVAIGL
ncbi:MAG: BNR repeat-containing protein, partial [Armatimonadota bacterium]|nr:BNR repeat-containing protein [Armatimonadota bacterium]